MTLKITILGCGNSTGVPAIGNYWGQCDPSEPKNIRTRSSIVVQSAKTNIVIDTGPDFKAQLNRADINHLDAAFFTHAHSDHVAGIEDLRGLVFRMEQSTMPIYANHETIEELEHKFAYLFNGGKAEIYPPILEAHTLEPNQFGALQSFGDIQYTPFIQDHGTCESIGYRFGDLAYSVDILTLDKTAINALKGIKTWVVDCTGYHSDTNPVHANLKTIYALNEEIQAQKIYLTSLSLGMDYQTMIGELPNGYAPAFDGLELMAKVQADSTGE